MKRMVLDLQQDQNDIETNNSPHCQFDRLSHGSSRISCLTYSDADDLTAQERECRCYEGTPDSEEAACRASCANQHANFPHL